MTEYIHKTPSTVLEEINDRLQALTAAVGVGAAVANLGASTNLTLTAPVAVPLNAVFSDTEVEAGLLAKADNSAVTTLMGVIETRLDNLEDKLNALLTSLRDSGQIVT